MEGKWECIGFEFITDEEERQAYGEHAFKAIIRRESKSTKVCITNAHIISAAPELLKLCESMTNLECGICPSFPDGDNCIPDKCLYAKARAAIAKVRGGEGE